MTYFTPKTEIWYDDQWNDISSRPYDRGKIVIRRGVSREGSRYDTTNVAMELDNTDGAFGRHPNASLYGKLGRNTPMRVYYGTPHPGAANSDLVDTTDHVAPSVTAPTSDGLLVCAWGCPGSGSYSAIPGSMTGVSTLTASGADLRVAREAIGSSGATGTRTATYDTTEDYVAVSVLLHGMGSIAYEASDNDQAGEHSISADAGDWLILLAYFGWDDADELTSYVPDYPHDHHEGGWILLADTGTQRALDPDSDNIRMKAWARRVKTTGTHELTLTTIGATLSTLVRASAVGEFDVRATVEVPGWPNKRDTSGNDRYVTVNASGVTRRAERNRQMARSPIFNRAIASEDLVAYWPGEDSSGSDSLAAATDDTNPMNLRTSGTATFASHEGFGGSKPLPVLDDEGNFRTSGFPALNSGSVYYRGLFSIPTGGVTNGASLLGMRCYGGDVARFEVTYGTGGTLNLRAFDDDGSVLDSTGAFSFDVDGTQFLLKVELVNDGADVDTLVSVTKVTAGGEVGTETTDTDTLTSLNMGRVFRMGIGKGGGLDGVAIGHQALGTSSNMFAGVDSALGGWLGETAANRFLRQCRQNSIAAVVVGDPDADVPLGFQRATTFFDLLKDLEEAGGGIIYEPREFRGLAYRTVGSLYNLPTVATVDNDTGQVAPPWEPREDGFPIRNDITLERYNGSSIRVTKETGPLNVADPADDPEAAGIYEDDSTQNVMADKSLRHHAYWRLHLGTVDEPRWPDLRVDLAREQELTGDTALVASVAALDVGDRLVVTNPPEDEPPDDISQLMLGSAETLSGFERSVGLVVAPQSPYRIAEVEDTDFQFVESDAATLNEDLDTTETGVDIVCGSGGPWTYESDFDIVVGGERMTVTAVGASSGTFPSETQTLTVTRSVNGITKAHSTGDDVEWFHKTYIGL